MISQPVCAGVIAAATLYTFFDFFHGEWHFLWDDIINFTENNYIHSLSFDNIRWMFMEGTILEVYEPFSWLLKAVVAATMGLSAQASLQASLILHIANAVGVFYLSEQILTREAQAQHGHGHSQSAELRRAALTCGALVFAVHPLRVQVGEPNTTAQACCHFVRKTHRCFCPSLWLLHGTIS
jgi:hypothetical protein